MLKEMPEVSEKVQAFLNIVKTWDDDDFDALLDSLYTILHNSGNIAFYEDRKNEYEESIENMSISDLNYELRYLYNDMEKIINQIERRSNA